MFRQKTLLVVGAGASFELGLPTGEQLKTELARQLNITFPEGSRQQTGDYQIAEHLRHVARQAGQTNWNYLLYKCWLIRDALPGALSIDNLLDAHASDKDLVLCGKVAIAKSILDAERSSRLYRTNPSSRQTVFEMASGTWLLPFFQMLTENVRKEDIGTLFENLVIVNFNYDRCLEQFLPLALASYYGIEKKEAEDCAARAIIVHPYGQVGGLDPARGRYHASFGAERYDLGAISEGIRTFAEGLADEELGDQIEATCSEAEKIVFLGFAFHPINMQILSTEKSSAATKIFGTTLGLSEAAKKVVRHTICQTFKKSDPQAPKSAIRAARDLDEINLDSLEAAAFLNSHFRGVV